jgi:flagella synthesis protein FlgN
MIPRARLLTQLAADVQRDSLDYPRLEHCLQALHGHLLAREADAIADANARINELLETLAQRARRRVRLLAALAVPRIDARSGGAVMHRLLSELPAPHGPRLVRLWLGLERQVLACQRLNQRNGRVLRLHHDLLHDLLDTDAGIYRPLA